MVRGLKSQNLSRQNHVTKPKSNDITTTENFSSGSDGTPTAPIPNERRLREVFKEHDADRDGRLSMEEIKKAFEEPGALIPAYRAYCGLNYADGNRDGFVDVNELEDLVKYARDLGYTVK